MKLFSKHLVAAFSLITVIAMTPTSAFARGSIHIDVPGFSIGVHNDRGYRSRGHRHSRKYNRRYYNSNRRYKKRYYNSRRYNNRRYNNRRYNDNYYSGGRGYNRGYYNDSYRAEVCPIDGYSRYYDRNQNCYEHKGHYHCS